MAAAAVAWAVAARWLSLLLTLLLAIGLFAFAFYVSAAEVLSQLQSTGGAMSQANRRIADLA